MYDSELRARSIKFLISETEDWKGVDRARTTVKETFVKCYWHLSTLFFK